MTADEIESDAIAQLVLDQYDKLPLKRKPQRRSASTVEWTILSGIVAQGEQEMEQEHANE